MFYHCHVKKCFLNKGLVYLIIVLFYCSSVSLNGQSSVYLEFTSEHHTLQFGLFGVVYVFFFLAVE